MEKMNYQNSFQRNIGFVSELEQEKIRNQKVFIVGVGGMGGAALINLVRMGYEQIGIADIDVFEESNLNRQLFCNLDFIGSDKAESSLLQIKKINPSIKAKNWGPNWINKIEEICQQYPIIINGCDDIVASNLIYMCARKNNVIVIDAYTASVPSVYVTRPSDPTPLMRWTGESDVDAQDASLIETYKMKETEYVMTNSNSISHIHMDIAMKMVHGKRPRMSLAPMVIGTGCLMAYQVLFLTLGKRVTNYHGYFLDPFGRVTKYSCSPINFIKRLIVRSILKSWS